MPFFERLRRRASKAAQTSVPFLNLRKSGRNTGNPSSPKRGKRIGWRSYKG
jgi:hypothetical protein